MKQMKLQNNFLIHSLMKGSDFIFDYVYLLHYKCHKVNPNRNESCIDSPDWIKI